MTATFAGPQNVAMLIQGGEVYGIGTIERLYAEHWPEMTFVCLGDGPMYDWLKARGSRVELIPGLSVFSPSKLLPALVALPGVVRQVRRDARQIHERLRGRDIRIVHTQWLPQQLIAGCMRKFGYAAVWQINNNNKRRSFGGVSLNLHHRLANWGADLLLPASNFIAANWQGCRPPIRVVHNAAKPLGITPNIAVDASPLRCLVAGRLEHSKGHHVAVEAVLAARSQGADVTLDIFGGPLEGNSYAEQLQSTVQAANSDNAIRFQGFCADLRQRHADYHVGLQCRLDPEPCSLWVCETLVDGLPLCASATGGTPELISDGETGWLYPPGDAATLSSLLVKFASDRQLLKNFRQAAAERGAKQFTVQRFLDETWQAYESLDLRPT